jgi:hypothetical protein
MHQRKSSSILIHRIALFTLAAIFFSTLLVGAGAKTIKPLVVRPSNVLSYLANRLNNEPNIDPKDLAAIGNKIIEEKGFDYQFNACDVVNRNPPKPDPGFEPREETWEYSLTLTGGKKIDVKFIIIEGPGSGGMCAECFFPLPTQGVTERQMLLVADGIQYRVKRPRSFDLDQAWLMDNQMKKKLRTWQLPYQLGPEGISPDGTKLYYGFYGESLKKSLVLELSEDGSTRFRPRSEVDLSDPGEYIVDYPKAQNVGDLTFVRFRVAGKSYIVKYTSPCT